MSKRPLEYLRNLLKTIAVYAAGAWVAIEVVDFAVRQYGLSRLLVDSAVIVAFGGGMVTAVLVWFHGEPGTQRIAPSEIVAISGIVVATALGLFYLSMGSPLKAFEDLPGYRLVLEYRNLDSPTELHHIGMSPPEAIEMIDGGILSLAPENGVIRGPDVHADFATHPTKFVAPPDSDFSIVTFVLPHQPADLGKLIALGSTHDGVTINTAGLSVEIKSSVVITEQENGATIHVSY